MQLIYIWINDYKNIHQKGYNLSSKYKINYNSDNKFLNIDLNKDYVKNFFLDKDRKSCNNLDIIGIVGANGSGKSTLLEEIWGACTVMPFDFIIYEDEDKNEIKICINDPIYNEMNIKVEDDINVIFCDQSIDDLEIVYYSNVFDCNGSLDYCFEVMDKRLHNISTNYLLNFSEFIVNDSWPITQRDVFNSHEILDEIIFIYEYKEQWQQLAPFKAPEEITLTLIELTDICNDEYDIKKYYKMLWNKCIFNSDNNILFFKDILYLNILLCFDKYENVLGNFLADYIFGNKDNHHISDDIKEILSTIKNTTSTQKDMKEYTRAYIESNVEKITTFIDGFENYLDTGEIVRVRVDRKTMTARLDVNMYIMLLNFKNNICGEIFLLGWYDMSSGEKCILSMYSRFYTLAKKSFIVNENILILIDEIDTYMHPEWQRNIINNLVVMCNDLFEKFNVQIIITSHSPFIISDLPSSNVVYLYGHDENATTENKSSLDLYTFAANIHTLYSKAFFLDNTIGEFATRKIKQVIKDLNEKSCDEIMSIAGRKEEIQYIINNIGEPIIKRKLSQLYQEKFPEQLDEYKLEIERLKGKINFLEKQLKETTD